MKQVILKQLSYNLGFNLTDYTDKDKLYEWIESKEVSMMSEDKDQQLKLGKALGTIVELYHYKGERLDYIHSIMKRCFNEVIEKLESRIETLIGEELRVEGSFKEKWLAWLLDQVIAGRSIEPIIKEVSIDYGSILLLIGEITEMQIRMLIEIPIKDKVFDQAIAVIQEKLKGTLYGSIEISRDHYKWID